MKNTQPDSEYTILTLQVAVKTSDEAEAKESLNKTISETMTMPLNIDFQVIPVHLKLSWLPALLKKVSSITSTWSVLLMTQIMQKLFVLQLISCYLNWKMNI